MRHLQSSNVTSPPNMELQLQLQLQLQFALHGSSGGMRSSYWMPDMCQAEQEGEK